MKPVAPTLILGCLLTAALAPCARLDARAPAGPRQGLPPGPRLMWSDPERLMPFGMDQLADELAVIAREMGAEIGLDLASPGDELGEHRYRVNIMRAPKAHWRLRADVMAAAPRAEGSQGTIYVFLEQVRNVLGHLADRDPSQAPREHAELATAMARILAHETVHLVAPDHPHATSGLMVANLRRSSLLKRRARIDPACARAFRRALAAEDHLAAPVLTTPR